MRDRWWKKKKYVEKELSDLVRLPLCTWFRDLLTRTVSLLAEVPFCHFVWWVQPMPVMPFPAKVPRITKPEALLWHQLFACCPLAFPFHQQEPEEPPHAFLPCHGSSGVSLNIHNSPWQYHWCQHRWLAKGKSLRATQAFAGSSQHP